METALAATVKDKAETICEAADLVYHLTVLLQDADLSWSDVIHKLKNVTQNNKKHRTFSSPTESAVYFYEVVSRT